jgi:large subunit ribosomal protein L3
MGGERITVQNLQIVRVDADKNMILVKGAVPGAKKGLLILKPSVKAK